MKSWRLAILPLLALAASGCNPGQHRAEVTVLTNEYRDLEDNFYQQQAAMKDLCQQLDACRKDLDDCRRENRRLQGLGPSSPETTSRALAAPATDTVKPPIVELPEGLRNSAPSSGPGASGPLKAPEEETQPTTVAPLSPYPPSSVAPPATDPAAKTLPDDSSPPASAMRSVSPAPPLGRAVQGDNTKVVAITLHPIVAGGRGADQPSGGDGIALWIEPRDQAGHQVRAAAPVAVVVLDPDPSMVGQAARVARWDFASEATAAFYRKTPTAEGIFLELTWPGEPPKHRTLEVFVRYTTDDGRKIEARRTIRIDLAGQPGVEPHAGWSRRAASAPVATTAYPTGESAAAAAKDNPVVSDAPASHRPGRVAPAGDESAEKPKLDLPAWSPDRP
jgi:hypothetical protein